MIVRMRRLLFGISLAALASCSKPVAFAPEDIARHRMLSSVPRGFGFFLGAATSAYQIEGGARTDWTDWEKGRDPDGTLHVLEGATAARAADSWNLWRQDVAALRHLGAN